MMIKHEPKSNQEKSNRLRNDIRDFYDSSGLTRQDIILGGTITSAKDDNDGSSLADQLDTLSTSKSSINKETMKTGDRNNRRQKQAFIDEAKHSYESEKYQVQLPF